jgi:hypothetical protein
MSTIFRIRQSVGALPPDPRSVDAHHGHMSTIFRLRQSVGALPPDPRSVDAHHGYMSTIFRLRQSVGALPPDPPFGRMLIMDICQPFFASAKVWGRGGVPHKIEMLFVKNTSDKTQPNKTKMAYAIHTQLADLQKENFELKKIIAAHADQIARNTQAVCQLYGGLYNQSEQKQVLKGHLKSLFGPNALEDDSESDIDDEDDEDIWPTTRQGDENEKRLKESEERLRRLEEQIAAMEKRQLEKLKQMENKL